eukprot:9502281-Pyramimonas_sp.AAC.1
MITERASDVMCCVTFADASLWLLVSLVDPIHRRPATFCDVGRLAKRSWKKISGELRLEARSGRTSQKAAGLVRSPRAF